MSTYTSYGSSSFTNLLEAQNMCNIVSDCTGVTQSNSGTITLRAAAIVITPSPTGETTWQKGI
eukprot:Awhi_evm1s3867